jgi:hypothetical protein
VAEATWVVSHDEWHTAFNGLTMQAKHFGVDVNEPCMHAFILHETEVISNLFAQARFLDGVLNSEKYLRNRNANTNP